MFVRAGERSFDSLLQQQDGIPLHKALAKHNAVSGWQGRRSDNLAECERDGILMGFLMHSS